MKQIIDEVSIREQLKTEQRILHINADAFKTYSEMNNLINMVEGSIPTKELKKLHAGIEEIKSHIEGIRTRTAAGRSA